MKKLFAFLVLTTFLTLILPTNAKAEMEEVGLSVINVNISDAEGNFAVPAEQNPYSAYGKADPGAAESINSIGASDLDSYGSDYLYNSLSDAGKELWDTLEATCKEAYFNTDKSYEKRGDYYPLGYARYEGIPNQEAQDIAFYFYYSNPQYFFLNSAVLQYMTGEDVGGISLSFYDGFQDGSDRQTAILKFETKLKEWNAAIAKETTAIKKEKKAHDLIVNNTVYKSGSAYNQSAYSNLVLGKSVCAGYSQSFALLMNHAGFDTFCVTSKYHEWNLIYYGCYWYNVDCTWDDPLTSTGQQILRYNYFNRSDEKIVSGDTPAYAEHKLISLWNDKTPSCAMDSGATAYSIGSTPTRRIVDVTFNAYGGYIGDTSVDRETMSVVYGKTYGSLPTPVRAGYKFLGWYTRKKDGTKITSSKKIISKNNHTLYARWKKVSVGRPTISKIKYAGSGVCKPTISKVSYAAGYEYQYSLTSTFEEYETVTTTSTVTLVTDLTAGQLYYFRVRAYAKDSTGMTVYGAYSKLGKYRAK